jgi:hypothetical protein
MSNITIPNTVTEINYGTFEGCSNLAEINIPQTVISIKPKAFIGTTWLENKQKENPLVILNHILIDATTCFGEVVIPETVYS